LSGQRAAHDRFGDNAMVKSEPEHRGPAGEVATATGLGRASVSSTLSELAQAGELKKAARGYQLAGVAAAQRFYFRIEDDVSTVIVV
jgi:hypothetical protein